MKGITNHYQQIKSTILTDELLQHKEFENRLWFMESAISQAKSFPRRLYSSNITSTEITTTAPPSSITLATPINHLCLSSSCHSVN